MRITNIALQYSIFSPIAYDKMTSSKWQSFPCFYTDTGLCQDEEGVIFFPHGLVTIADYPLQSFPSNLKLNNTILQHHQPLCTAKSTGRVTTDDYIPYKFSLCDLLNGDFDLVLDIDKDVMYWRVNDTSVYEYIFIALMAIFCMSLLSNNISRLLQKKNPTSMANQMYSTVLALIYVVGSFFWGNLQYLTTQDDINLLWILILFLGVDIAIIMFKVKKITQNTEEYTKEYAKRHVKAISQHVVVLLLLSVAIFCTFDNPYVYVLTSILGIRVCSKLYTFMSNSDTDLLQFVFIILDLAVYCLILEYAIARAQIHTSDVIQQQAIIIFFSLTLASVILNYTTN